MHTYTHTNMQCVCSRKPYVAKCGNLFAMQRLDWEPYILDMCARLAFTIAAATINIEASHCRTFENTLSCEQRGLECARLEKNCNIFISCIESLNILRGLVSFVGHICKVFFICFLVLLFIIICIFRPGMLFNFTYNPVKGM